MKTAETLIKTKNKQKDSNASSHTGEFIINIVTKALREIAYKVPYYVELRFMISSMVKKVRCLDDDYIEIKCKDLKFSFRISEDVRKSFYIAGFSNRLNRLRSEYLISSISFSDNDIVIDCGANIGEIGLYFRSVSCSVRYYGFEPSLREFECCAYNNPGQNIVNKGLWNETGVHRFYQNSSQADSSFIEINEYDYSVEVPVVRLDEFDIGDNHETIKFMKIEAEGAEPEVIEGARQTLKRIMYVSVEVGAERGKLLETTVVPVLNALMKQGFELVEFGYPRFVVLLRNSKLLD